MLASIGRAAKWTSGDASELAADSLSSASPNRTTAHLQHVDSLPHLQQAPADNQSTDAGSELCKLAIGPLPPIPPDPTTVSESSLAAPPITPGSRASCSSPACAASGDYATPRPTTRILTAGSVTLVHIDAKSRPAGGPARPRERQTNQPPHQRAEPVLSRLGDGKEVVRSQESGVRSQESGVRSQNSVDQ